MVARLTTPKFIEKAKKRHGSKFKYSKTIYYGQRAYSIVTCTKHGDFEVMPEIHTLRNSGGCTQCGIDERISIVEARKRNSFLTKAIEVYGNMYDYSQSVYVDRHTKIKIICSKHGVFEKYPKAHLCGYGCPWCSQELAAVKNSHSTESFVLKAISIHGNTYDYSKVIYKGSFTEVTIGCKEHGYFMQTPSNHLAGRGCYTCGLSKIPPIFSSIAIQWIEEYAYRHRLKNVIHAGNSSEYIIPTTRYKVDGYHPRSKTILEFHGSCWHGDPEVHKPNSRPHPFSPLTAKQLYNNTLQREDTLKSLGYKVVVVWEKDYKEGKLVSYVV